MFRPLIALSLLLSTQAQASAFDSIQDQDMQASAYTLLVTKADSISLRGDIHKGEKLAPIVAAVEEYYRQMEEVLMSGGNLETDLKSNIDHVDTRYERNETKTSAQCDLTIQFKPLGETTVRFNVTLGSDDKAVDISSTAEVFRGD